MNHFRKFVSRMIESITAGTEIRFDAGETAILARQIEHIRARTFDIKYAEYKGRLFVPVDNSAPSGAQSITYRQWDWFGMAEIITNFADDLPRVDVLAKEFTAPVRSIGASYGFSIQDLRASAMAGAQLDVRRATAARRAIESRIDKMIAEGDAEHGVTGFLNNTNVPLITPTTGSWAGATVTQIRADLNKLVNSIVNTTLEVEIPDTLILDNTSFQLLASLQLSVDNDKTLLQSWLESNPYIRNVDQWHRLNTANAGGNGPRIVAYKRDPEVLAAVIPQEFEQFAPQQRNLDMVIPVHARSGGVEIRYPLAIAYMDGV